MNCKCMRCGGGYNSHNLEDVEGDGKCQRCKDFSKKVARIVDAKMAERRRRNPIPASPLKKFIDHGGQIRARDLGIHFGP